MLAVYKSHFYVKNILAKISILLWFKLKNTRQNKSKFTLCKCTWTLVGTVPPNGLWHKWPHVWIERQESPVKRPVTLKTSNSTIEQKLNSIILRMCIPVGESYDAPVSQLDANYVRIDWQKCLPTFLDNSPTIVCVGAYSKHPRVVFNRDFGQLKSKLNIK